MENLKKMTTQENQILESTETDLIPEAMKRRDFLAMMLRDSVRRLLISKKKDNFYPHLPTSQHDSAVIIILEKDDLNLSMNVRVRWEDLKLPVAISDKSSKSDNELLDLESQISQLDDECCVIYSRKCTVSSFNIW